jgi:hypothetical protein
MINLELCLEKMSKMILKSTPFKMEHCVKYIGLVQTHH